MTKLRSASSIGRVLLSVLFIAVFLSTAFAAKTLPPASTALLTGKVTNAVTLAVIVNADVSAVGAAGTFAAVTDSKGVYKMTLPGGIYQITASATGFGELTQTRTLTDGVTTTLAFALTPAGGAALPHASKISSYAGPQTCLNCHSAAIADQVFASAHFQVRTLSVGIDMPGGGSHGMVDRACGLPGTTMMANNFAGKAVSPVDGVSTKDDGCGSCHLAYLPPYYYGSSSQALNDIDCLRCHAEVYGDEWEQQDIIDLYGANMEPHSRQVVTNAEGVQIYSQDRSLKTAQSVGKAVTTEACLRCHEHGMGGYKRSTPFDAANDLHAAKGLKCTTCHAVSQHRIARGNFVTDGVANDLPEVQVSCMNGGCHSTAPHNLEFAAELNRHVANVSCEVCHILSMNEPDNIFRRAWAPSTFDPMTGQWLATPARTDGEYPGFWDAYTEYHAIGTNPTVRWFNGGASMLAQPYGGFADRKSAGGASKLFCFKPFVSGMLFDAAWLPGPPRDGSFDLVNGTWPASMKSFYEQNWAKFVAFGFADPAYPTAAAYWLARPDLAAMLNNFPMMLQFDRSIYLSEAGTVLGSPLPGPQTAAGYPGIVKAINTGMGKMAVDLGYFPPETPLASAGAYLWSGSFFGMWVPPNMDPNSPFFGEVVSFITQSHAIKKRTAAGGTACYFCHLTADEYAGVVPLTNKAVDYVQLGYPDYDGNGKVDPMYDRQVTPEVCNDGIDNDGDGQVDCLDGDCLSAPECMLQAETLCDDKVDNDGDNKVDCADADCLGLAGCGPEGLSTTCSDKIDNDGDGLTDCADPGCVKNRSCR